MNSNRPDTSCTDGFPWKYWAGFVTRVLFFLLLIPLLVGLGVEQVLQECFPYPSSRLTRYGDSTRVLSEDGSLLRVVPNERNERRIRVPYEQIPSCVRQALVASEDSRFYSHSGVDPLAVVRAAVTNLRHGRIVSGASTIPMQLVRIFNSRPRTFRSKIIEAFRARQLSERLSQEEIIERYLNNAPWGGTLRGIEAASRYWYGKSSRDLNHLEAATLVAMLPAPSDRAPDRHPEKLRTHRNDVLEKMVEQGMLSRRSGRRLRQRPVRAEPHLWAWDAPHYCDFVLKREGQTDSSVLRTGLDRSVQEKVERAVRERRGALPGDSLAVVVTTVEDGKLRAMMGSKSWYRTPFNAADARHSSGSTLKPFLYAAGITSGQTSLSHVVRDRPVRYSMGEAEPAYEPENFDRTFRGGMLAGNALVQSRNIPAMELLRNVGVSRFRTVLVNLGLSPRPRMLGLGSIIGTIEVTPVELSRAYARFADPEFTVPGLTWFARRSVLEELASRSPERSLLAGERVAWKTGTSSNRRDAWCAAVSGEYVVVVWLGNMDGSGNPDFVGGEAAAELTARVCALLHSL